MNILKRRSLKLTSAFLVLCILTTFCVFEAEAYTEELRDFTVSEEYLDTVTVDGVEVMLTEGSYTILADNVIHTIMVTDKAGNCVTYEIGVYEEEESKPEIEPEEPAEIPKDTEPTDSEVSSNVEDASDAANYGLLIAAAGIVTVAMLGVVFIKRRRNKTGN